MDEEKNFYIAFVDGIRKVSPAGELLWTYTAPDPYGISVTPALMDGSVFGLDAKGHIFRVDKETGDAQWVVRPYKDAGMDSGYVGVHDGVVVVGIENYNMGRQQAANNRVSGVNATDGHELWSFVPDTPTWNFHALFANDGTFVFQDFDGKAYRLGVYDGRLFWKAGGSNGDTWTDGGAALGPNRVVYAVANAGHQLHQHPDLPSTVSAYRLDDGELLWRHAFQRPTYTFPVVGDLQNGDGPSVIVGIGAMPTLPISAVCYFCALYLGFLPRFLWGFFCLKGMCHRLPQRCASYVLVMLISALLGGAGFWLWLLAPTFQSEVWALQAFTGRVQWKYELPVNEMKVNAGDPEGFFTREYKGISRFLCMPATFNSPTIDGGGVAYIGHCDGKVYAIRDSDGDGLIDGGAEVSTYDAGTAFLHSGVALAPGTLAVTTCDGLHVMHF